MFKNVFALAMVVLLCSKTQVTFGMKKNPAVWAQEFLYAARTNAPTDSLRQLFETISTLELAALLQKDSEKIAFWINMYNALTIIDLATKPEDYTNRNEFFKQKRLALADLNLSLDHIEHRILRRSKIKWAMGYLQRWFIPAWERRLRVEILDFRIHFALNCGAASCPPIAFYEADALNKQLQLATENYLQNHCVLDSTKNSLGVPKLFCWFRGDFGGKKGIKTILNQFTNLKINNQTKWHYLPYDWTLALNN